MRGVNIMSVSQLTEGTASTVLLAHRIINNSDALLIANSDELIDVDINLFIDDCHSRGLDGQSVFGPVHGPQMVVCSN